MIVDRKIIEKNADRVLERVSPSQIETFELCQRRWYYQSICGLREATTNAQLRGLDIGKMIETFYLTRVWISEVTCEQKGCEGKGCALCVNGKRNVEHYLPLAQAIQKQMGPWKPNDISVEQWVSVKLSDVGIEIAGRYDHFDAEVLPRDLGKPACISLSDIKCRSDKKYAKTPEQLINDVQMNMYGVALLEKHGHDVIALRHVYGITKKAKTPVSFPVTAVATKEELRPRFEKTRASVAEMKKWAILRPDNADGLPPNSEACDKFPPNGCPHRALCGFNSPFQSAFQNRSEQMAEGNGAGTEDLMTRLMRAKAEVEQKTAPQAPVAAPPPAPAQAHVAAPAPNVAASVPNVPTTAPTAPVAMIFCQDCGTRFKLSDGKHIGCQGSPAVVPPDAPPRTVQPEDIAAQEEAPKKRGRKPKAETEAPTVGTAEAPTQATAPPVVQRTSEGAALQASGPIIYLNCVPTKGAHKGAGMLFEEWLAPIAEELAKEKGVVDWRLIQYTSKGDLAAKIRIYVKTLPEVVLVSKFSPAADVFMEAVIPYASQIIQGL